MNGVSDLTFTTGDQLTIGDIINLDMLGYHGCGIIYDRELIEIGVHQPGIRHSIRIWANHNNHNNNKDDAA